MDIEREEIERLHYLSTMRLRNDMKWDCNTHNVSYEEIVELTLDGILITYIFGGDEIGTVCTLYYDNRVQFSEDFRDVVYTQFRKDFPTLKKQSLTTK